MNGLRQVQVGQRTSCVTMGAVTSGTSTSFYYSPIFAGKAPQNLAHSAIIPNVVRCKDAPAHNICAMFEQLMLCAHDIFASLLSTWFNSVASIRCTPVHFLRHIRSFSHYRAHARSASHSDASFFTKCASCRRAHVSISAWCSVVHPNGDAVSFVHMRCICADSRTR